MKPLKERFSKNGLNYTLVQRNDVVAIYGVSGTYTQSFTHYEVCKITIVPAGEMFGSAFPEHEALPSNEQFGRDGSRAILDHDEALKYFAELTTAINTPVEAEIGLE